MIRSPAEQLPREKLRALQLERLRATFGLDLAGLDELESQPAPSRSPRSATPIPSASCACR